MKVIDNAYNGIITWRKNLFKLLSGKAPKLFIKELTTGLEHYNNNIDFQGISLKLFIVLPRLILQKLFKNSKVKDHCRKMNERIKLLLKVCILDIIKDCKNTQRRQVVSKRQTTNEISKTYNKLMLARKVNTALKLSTTECDNGVHDVNDEVISESE